MIGESPVLQRPRLQAESQGPLVRNQSWQSEMHWGCPKSPSGFLPHPSTASGDSGSMHQARRLDQGEPPACGTQSKQSACLFSLSPCPLSIDSTGARPPSQPATPPPPRKPSPLLPSAVTLPTGSSASVREH